MKKYIDILGAKSPSTALKEAVEEIGVSLATGTIGAVAWKKHRVLGFLGGSSVGASGFNVTKGEYGEAASHLVVASTSTFGSLKWKKHPVLGFLGGYVVGAGLSMLIPKSRR